MRTQKRMDARWIAPRFRTASSALLLVLVAASAPAASPVERSTDDSRISVTAVAGRVDVTMAGKPAVVDRDATMLLPARIVTGHDGMLGLTQADTNIIVSNDTDIEIPAEAVDGNLVARLVQRSGNVFYDVAPREVGKLRVETPFLVAVIKGTQFNVAVEQDRTTISLFEGRLEIRTPDDSGVFELNAGEIAIRSLIDDSIRIVGMNDELAAAPRGAAPVAADAAPAAATQGVAEPGAADAVAAPAASREAGESRAAARDRAMSVNDAVVADGGTRLESGIVVSAEKRSPVDGGPALVALDRRNDHARDRGLPLDVQLDTVDVGLAADAADPGDVGLEAGVDIGGGAVEILDAIPDADAELDLGRVLDLDTVLNTSVDAGLGGDPALDLNVDVELDVRLPGGPPGLDGGGPPGLDGGGPSGLDVELDVDIELDTRTVDIELPEQALPTPRGRPGVPGLP